MSQISSRRCSRKLEQNKRGNLCHQPCTQRRFQVRTIQRQNWKLCIWGQSLKQGKCSKEIMPSAKEDVVDPCPGLDACPLLLPSSLGRGQDDVCGVVPSLTQTPPLRPCKKLRLTAEHDVVDPWQGLVVIEERKTQPGFFPLLPPKQDVQTQIIPSLGIILEVPLEILLGMIPPQLLTTLKLFPAHNPKLTLSVVKEKTSGGCPIYISITRW